VKTKDHCHYEVVVNGRVCDCGKPVAYRIDRIYGVYWGSVPLCKEHGEAVASYGQRVVPHEELTDE